MAHHPDPSDGDDALANITNGIDFWVSNNDANITNPLRDLSDAQLRNDVQTFVTKKGLATVVDVSTVYKGAILAKDSHYLDELDDDEKDAIHLEKEHKWNHPFMLYMTIILCSIGAVAQGWVQTGSNGANLSFPDEFGIPYGSGQPYSENSEQNSWIVGVVNAAPYLGSAICGCWISDPLNNYLGRRGAIFVAALILIATPIASAFTHSWEELLLVRMTLGIGMGIKASTIPVYAAEVSPAQIRGTLVMSWQLLTAFGIFLGFAANVIVENVGQIAWRLQLGSAFIPAVPLAFFIFLCPESPRWLIKKDDYKAAYASLCRLRRIPLQAARDLYYIHVQLVEEEKVKYTYFIRLIDLVTIPRIRRATLASHVVMISQQLCGINIIAFYSSTVFLEAGHSAHQALLASLGFGAINFIFALPALRTIDTFGRRDLLLYTFPLMALTMLATGLCFFIPESAGSARLAATALFIYLFTIFYSPGAGPVPYTYSAEVFPLKHRDLGMAWAVVTNLGWAAGLSITFPRMLMALTPVGVFSFYASLNIVALILIFLLVPETKKRTLEELDQVFTVPSRVFAKYQVTQTLPSFFKRWFRWQRGDRPQPLYNDAIELEERR